MNWMDVKLKQKLQNKNNSLKSINDWSVYILINDRLAVCIYENEKKNWSLEIVIWI